MNIYTPPPDTGLDIMHKDDALLIINKPAGLLSVPGQGKHKQDCLTSRARQEYPEVLSVHRLDMATSGLLIMARNRDAHRDLSRQFQDRRINKRYTAVVDGQVDCDQGEIELPLACDWPNRPRQVVDFATGKPSTTLFRVLSRDRKNNSSRLQLEAKTGRTHQLRVHLQALGHAIIGDRLYASKQVYTKAGRLLLHAEQLSFIHPDSNQAIHIDCKAPF